MLQETFIYISISELSMNKCFQKRPGAALRFSNLIACSLKFYRSIKREQQHTFFLASPADTPRLVILLEIHVNCARNFFQPRPYAFSHFQVNPKLASFIFSPITASSFLGCTLILVSESTGLHNAWIEACPFPHMLFWVKQKHSRRSLNIKLLYSTIILVISTQLRFNFIKSL